MLSTLRAPFALVGQLYRSGQAFFALRQLHGGASRGLALSDSPAMGRFARALGVHPTVARDVYMGVLRPDSAAEDIVGAHRTLRGARLLQSWLLPTSHHTAALTRSVLADVARTHTRALAANSRELVRRVGADRAAGRQIQQLTGAGLRHRARAAREARSFNVQAMEELSAETAVLLAGRGGKF